MYTRPTASGDSKVQSIEVVNMTSDVHIHQPAWSAVNGTSQFVHVWYKGCLSLPHTACSNLVSSSLHIIACIEHNLFILTPTLIYVYMKLSSPCRRPFLSVLSSESYSLLFSPSGGWLDSVTLWGWDLRHHLLLTILCLRRLSYELNYLDTTYCTISTGCSVTGHKRPWTEHQICFVTGHKTHWTAYQRNHWNLPKIFITIVFK